MVELARELLAGEEAWVVGGAIRDELLGRELVDLDIACAEPERAARAYARRAKAAVFPLSLRHGGWRVALDRELPVGTPVVLLGHGVLAEEHARVAGTINYEIVCGVNSDPTRARRTVLDG